MGVAIYIQQARGVDVRIDLRRGQAGVTQQLLERSQIGAARQQMGRKAVSEGVRVRLSGRPSRLRAPRTARRTRSGLRGPPLAPTNSGVSPESGKDKARHRR